MPPSHVSCSGTVRLWNVDMVRTILKHLAAILLGASHGCNDVSPKRVRFAPYLAAASDSLGRRELAPGDFRILLAGVRDDHGHLAIDFAVETLRGAEEIGAMIMSSMRNSPDGWLRLSRADGTPMPARLRPPPPPGVDIDMKGVWGLVITLPNGRERALVRYWPFGVRSSGASAVAVKIALSETTQQSLAKLGYRALFDPLTRTFPVESIELIEQ
jgi:hypothetical protein